MQENAQLNRIYQTARQSQAAFLLRGIQQMSHNLRKKEYQNKILADNLQLIRQQKGQVPTLLQRNMSQYQQKMRESNKNAQHLQIKLKELQKAIPEYVIKINLLSMEVERLCFILKQKDQQIRDLKQKIDENCKKSRNRVKTQPNPQHQNKIFIYQAAMKQITQQNKQLKQSVRKAQSKQDRDLNSQFSRYEKKIAQLNYEIEQKNKIIFERQRQFDEAYETKNQRLTNQIKRLNYLLVERERQISGFHHTVTALKKQIQFHKEKNSEKSKFNCDII